jgi:two-component system nitrate/nitrite response regulator NarL
MALSVLIVDDHRLTATALADSLSVRGMEVAGVCHSVGDAVGSVQARQPDVVITDLDLGVGPTGIDLALTLRKKYPRIGLVLLTAYEDPKLLAADTPVPPAEAVYLVKQRLNQVDDLVAAIDLAFDYARNPQKVPRAPFRFPLSGPQAEVLRLLAQGASNHSIAEQLHLTPDAVAKAINRLAKRFGLGQSEDTNVRVLLTQRYFDLVGYQREL